MSGENEGFATRWSKRKIAALEEGEGEFHGEDSGLPESGQPEKRQQDDDQEIFELSRQNRPRRDTMRGLELVRAVES